MKIKRRMKPMKGKIEKYEIQLLDPLFYNSFPDSGAAGSSITSNFIGDISLDYSIVNSLCLVNTFFGYSTNKPNYEELRDFPILCTVAKPVDNTNEPFTRVYDFATSFVSEGYPQVSSLQMSGKTSYKQWIKRRGIGAGNKFTCFIINKSSDDLPIHFTSRIGNMKSTLCLFTKSPINYQTDTAWINIYTLGVLFHVNKLLDEPPSSIYFESFYYRIMKNISMPMLKEISEVLE